MIMIFGIYSGSSTMQKVSAAVYCLRIIVIICWGSYLMSTEVYLIGEQILDRNHLVSLYFTIFITVREIILFPVLILKAYFKTKYD